MKQTERFNRVTEVLSDGSISLAAVASITGICNGALPTAQILQQLLHLV